MKIKVLLALYAMIFLFCACSNLDTDSSSDRNPDETPLVAIKNLSCFENGKLILSWDYDYDSKGRVNHIYTMGAESYFNVATITYEDGLVRLETDDEYEASYRCDDDGRLEQMSSSPHNGNPGWVVEYDKSGYICSFTTLRDDPEKFDIIASGGNYTFMGWNYIEYTDYPNKYSIDMNWMTMFLFGFELFDETYALKFKNGYSKNLIKSIKTDETEKRVTYVFDDSSNVTDIKCQIFLLGESKCLDEVNIKVGY